MRRIVTVLLAVVLLTVGTAALEFDYVFDGAGLLTEDELSKVSIAAEEVYSNSGLLCVAVTDYGISDMLSSLPKYAQGAVDMALLSIDMSAREFELLQYNSETGEDAFRISYSESQTILDDIFDYMADGEYAEAMLLYISLAEEYFLGGEVFDSDNVGSDYEYISYEDEFSLFDVILPLFFGAAVGGIVVLFVWLSYKKKVHGSTYPLSQYSKLNLTDTKDNFVRKNVVVTRIPDPPESSGGGRGGSSSGGGGASMGSRKF